MSEKFNLRLANRRNLRFAAKLPEDEVILWGLDPGEPRPKAGERRHHLNLHQTRKREQKRFKAIRQTSLR